MGEKRLSLKKARIAIPIVEGKGLESSGSLHFGSVPYFVFIDVEEGQIIGSRVKAYESFRLSQKKGIQAPTSWLKKMLIWY